MNQTFIQIFVTKIGWNKVSRQRRSIFAAYSCRVNLTTFFFKVALLNPNTIVNYLWAIANRWEGRKIFSCLRSVILAQIKGANYLIQSQGLWSQLTRQQIPSNIFYQVGHQTTYGSIGNMKFFIKLISMSDLQRL